jgi:predicted GH43/DUF377 family glycosyl hydrolase
MDGSLPGTFNPSAVVHDGKVVVLYRAQDSNGTSRLGYATSTDGISFIRRPSPCCRRKPSTRGVADSRIRAW